MRVGIIFLTAIIILITGVSGCATINAERAAPAIGKFVDVDGYEFHVFEAGAQHKGTRPTIVLIHGASVNLRDMKLALGDPLSERYHVVMIDRPGRGYSDRPKDGFQLARQASIINGALGSLNIKDPIVVGQSFGGAVALAYALEYQREMSGLVLLAAVSHEWPGGVVWYNRVSNIPVLGLLLRRLVVPIYGQFAGPSGVDSSFAPDEAPDNYYQKVGLPLLFRPKDFKSNAEDIFNLKAEIIAQQSRYGELDLPVRNRHGRCRFNSEPGNSLQDAGDRGRWR